MARKLRLEYAGSLLHRFHASGDTERPDFKRILSGFLA